MNRKDYISSEIASILSNWATIALIGGAIIIMFLSLLDYFVTPENFKQFLIYRVITALLFSTIYLVNRFLRGIRTQNIVYILATLIVSSMVALMMFHFGGHESPYTFGVFVTIVFVIGTVPLSLKISLINALLIYTIYLLPILFYERITNIPFFISSNAFIIALIAISLTWRYISQKRLINEIGLQYDLMSEKNKLKDYSSHLEITVQERTKDLRKSEAMLQTLHENANDGIIITDKDGIILKINQRASDIHGFEGQQMVGMNAALLELEKNKTVWNERMDRLLNRESIIYETEHYKKDGTTVNLEISSKAITITDDIYIQSIHRDITEKKKLQTQLLHSQKMESIGTLAGGIAHDFNNILTSILGFTDLILDSDEPSQDIAKKVRIIESSARKGSSLVSKLLSFARRGSIEAVPFDVNPIIEDSVTMLSRLIPKNIIITNKLNHMIPPVIGDANQIEQILMNLIINARDAMPNGGEITISSSDVILDPGTLNIATDVRKGVFIKISVRDTGTGIAEKDLERIFEPFYSTKEVGKGTGLGLAMVYGIIKEHGGYILVNSEMGAGTTFDVYLPASPSHIATKQGILSDEQFTIQGEIIVIDDEIPVLEFVRQSLLKDGLNVKVFDSPVDGIAYYREHSNRVSLVITDIVMPRMDGNQLISAIRAIKPDEKIIATTGFGKVLGDVKIDGLLKKPFQSSKLIGLVRQVISRDKSKR